MSCDAAKKRNHVITHSVLFFDFPNHFAILVERLEDIDTLSVYARFRTPRLPIGDSDMRFDDLYLWYLADPPTRRYIGGSDRPNIFHARRRAR